MKPTDELIPYSEWQKKFRDTNLEKMEDSDPVKKALIRSRLKEGEFYEAQAKLRKDAEARHQAWINTPLGATYEKVMHSNVTAVIGLIILLRIFFWLYDPLP